MNDAPFNRKTVRNILLLLALAGMLPSCGPVRKTKAKVRKMLEVVDRVEKLAEGDKSQILPLAKLAIEEIKGLKVVHQDDNGLVIQVRQIPGTKLRIPTAGGKRYYLRISLKSMAKQTKVVLHFFRSAKGKYLSQDSSDSIISRGAKKLFASVIAALIKSGVAFK